MNVLTGFGGIILGIIAVLIDLRSSGKWYVSGALLVLYGIFRCCERLTDSAP